MFLAPRWLIIQYLQKLYEESRGCGTTSYHRTSKLLDRTCASKLSSSDGTSVSSSAAGISTGRGGRASHGWPRIGEGVVAAGGLVREGSTGCRYRIRTTVVVRLVSDRNEVRAESSVNEVGKFCTLNQHPECMTTRWVCCTHLQFLLRRKEHPDRLSSTE